MLSVGKHCCWKTPSWVDKLCIRSLSCPCTENDRDVGGLGGHPMSLRDACVAFLIICAALYPSRVHPQSATPPRPNPTAQNLTPQNLAPQNLQGGPQVASPGFSVPASVTTEQTTLGLGPSTSMARPSFQSAGRGLPGMPGGPPLGGVDGAIDPSGTYMTPPVVGPLFCDPALNIPC